MLDPEHGIPMFLEQVNELYERALTLARDNGYMVLPINPQGELLEFAVPAAERNLGKPVVHVQCDDEGVPECKYGYQELFDLVEKFDSSFGPKRLEVRALGQEYYSLFRAIELLNDGDSAEAKSVREDAKQMQKDLPYV